MNKNVENSNEAQNPKLGISDVMYRLFWYSIFLIVPYLFISFLWMDIWWMNHHYVTRIFYCCYSTICFVPCVILGVWTPKGMRGFK
jgi:hypothetical protein